MPGPDAASGGGRLVSLDAYRGFVMLAMASAGFALGEIVVNRPGDIFWQVVADQTEHASWRGCTAWDLIQPSFMFIVGVAMPFSFAARRDRGDGFGRQLSHALARSAALVVLGVFLSSAWGRQTNFVFVNVLCQIGLAYPFVYLALRLGPRAQFGMALAVLAAYGLWFALTPLPDTSRDVLALGGRVESDKLSGFFLHWARNTNPAADFDRWFLNLFPRPAGQPFRFNPDGYATLNFVPSVATMLFGVVAGEWLRSDESGRTKVFGLILAGACGILVGRLLGSTACPIVKKIWTPSWAIYSAGWTCGLLAVFYVIIDVAGFRKWAFPLVVVGLNSIAVYVMAQLMKPWLGDQLRIHFTTALQVAERFRLRWFQHRGSGQIPLRPFEGEFGPVVQSAAALLAIWIIAFWMYRRKVFIRL